MSSLYAACSPVNTHEPVTSQPVFHRRAEEKGATTVRATCLRSAGDARPIAPGAPGPGLRRGPLLPARPVPQRPTPPVESLFAKRQWSEIGQSRTTPEVGAMRPRPPMNRSSGRSRPPATLHHGRPWPPAIVSSVKVGVFTTSRVIVNGVFTPPIVQCVAFAHPVRHDERTDGRLPPSHRERQRPQRGPGSDSPSPIRQESTRRFQAFGLASRHLTSSAMSADRRFLTR
jgi:hypothetical protein